MRLIRRAGNCSSQALTCRAILQISTGFISFTSPLSIKWRRVLEQYSICMKSVWAFSSTLTDVSSSNRPDRPLPRSFDGVAEDLFFVGAAVTNSLYALFSRLPPTNKGFWNSSNSCSSKALVDWLCNASANELLVPPWSGFPRSMPLLLSNEP